MDLKKSSMVRINDLVDELSEENKRLLNELLFADKYLNLFIEFKTFIDSICSQLIEQNLNENQLQKYKEFDRKISEINGQKRRQRVDSELKSKPKKFKCDVNSIDKRINIKIIDFEDNPGFNQSTKSSKSVTKTQAKPKTNVKTDQTLNICDFCGQELSSAQVLLRHTKSHKEYYKSGDNFYVCKDYADCDHRSATKDSFIAHLNHHKDLKPFACSACDMSFACRSSLSHHSLRRHGGQSDGRPFICDIDNCNKQFTSHRSLTSHQNKIHREKRFVCDHPNCSYRSLTPIELKKHRWIHSTNRTIKCTADGCEKMFADSDHLKIHLKTHVTSRDHRCPYEACDKAYSTKQQLNIHISAVHLEKRVVCEWPGCDYKTHDKKVLAIHVASIHSDERKFACHWPGCGQAFKIKTSLNYHLKTHTGKPHACHWPGCHYRFTTPFALRGHIETHTPDIKYSCDRSQCGQQFKTKRQLAKHIKAQHK